MHTSIIVTIIEDFGASLSNHVFNKARNYCLNEPSNYENAQNFLDFLH